MQREEDFQGTRVQKPKPKVTDRKPEEPVRLVRRDSPRRRQAFKLKREIKLV